MSEFVDVINSTRYDHVITIESQIRRVHEKRLSFISQPRFVATATPSRKPRARRSVRGQTSW